MISKSSEIPRGNSKSNIEMTLLQTVLLLVAITLVSPALLASSPSAAEAKYFRSDAGVADSAAALPDNFQAPESLVWRVPLDSGHSTPVTQRGKVLLTRYPPHS